LYRADEHFQHPITAGLTPLPPGFLKIPSAPGGLALDYLRNNLVTRGAMQEVPPNVSGADNDLNDHLDHYVQRAIRDSAAEVYAFGERWPEEPTKPDKIFGFKPGNGIHDIHMNQGNGAGHTGEDGVWQDGALLLHFPGQSQWVAIFLAFQSQAWHTDDRSGHALPGPVPSPMPGPGPTPTPVPGPTPTPTETELTVRIVAAMVNPRGGAPEKETVTLLNASPNSVDLGGWAIADRLKNKHALAGKLAAGATVQITLPASVQLGNSGGIITLLDKRGLKVDGVAYTAAHAQHEGWTVVF
jgi:uncharacterized protein YukJ